VKRMKTKLENAFYKTLLASLSGSSGSRSSKRTDDLHTHFEKDILKEINHTPGEYFHERKIKTADGSFNVDIIFENANIQIAILLKSIASSFNKNRKNYANTIMGEAFRYLSGYENRRLLHVNYIPTTAPRFNKEGDVLAIENTKPQDLSYFYEQINNTFSRKPLEVNFKFEINSLIFENANTRKEIYENLRRIGPSSIRSVNSEEQLLHLVNFFNNENSE